MPEKGQLVRFQEPESGENCLGEIISIRKDGRAEIKTTTGKTYYVPLAKLEVLSRKLQDADLGQWD